jgi:hypothetical protein
VQTANATSTPVVAAGSQDEATRKAIESEGNAEDSKRP